MDLLLRRPTKTTPYVHLNRSSGTYVISGRSIPIDAELFYKPVLSWMDEVVKSPPGKVEFCFKLDFINIASSKRVLFILYKLDELARQGCKVTVRWMYEKSDEDSLEIGQDYEFMVEHLRFIFEEFTQAELNESSMMKFG